MTCMRRPAALVALLTVAAAGFAAGPRAWQQRLDVQLPLAMPFLELEPVNPFFRAMDEPPRLESFRLPEDVDAFGTALVAVHVDAAGTCGEVVPLEVPFPGLATVLVAELRQARYEPARAGADAVPSWSVLEVEFSSRVESGRVVDQTLEPPDPAEPPTRFDPFAAAESERLGALPAADPATLTVRAAPKRVRARVPGREVVVGVRLLVRITPEGRCDRYVPLEMDSGLGAWVEGYLESWQLEPATAEGRPVEAWMTWTARLGLELGAVRSRELRVARERSFTPGASVASPSAPSPPAG